MFSVEFARSNFGSFLTCGTTVPWTCTVCPTTCAARWLCFLFESERTKEHKADCDCLRFRLKTHEGLTQRKHCSRNRSIILPWVMTNREGQLMIAEEFPIRCIKKLDSAETEPGNFCKQPIHSAFQAQRDLWIRCNEPVSTAPQHLVTFKKSCSCQSRTPSLSPCGFHKASNQRFWMLTARESDVEIW